MNWRVSDDQTASYFSATRCQPSYSNRVNSSPFLTARAKWLQLLQRKFDRLFFLPRNEFISLNDSSTCVPTEQSIIISGGTNCFCPFKPAHRFPKKIVGLESATGCVLDQLCFGTAFGKNSGVISALIFAANARE